jgi:hypothetical protein
MHWYPPPSSKLITYTIILGLLTTIAILGKHNAPLKTEGGIVKIKEFKKIGTIEGVKPKVEEINIYLDSTRINRLNQRRNLCKIKDYLGPNSAFKPLLELTVTGPINIELKGEKSFNQVLFHVPEGHFKAQVYPEFLEDFLKTGNNQEEETIKIYAQRLHGPKWQVDEIKTKWSGPNDLFLSHKNLIDIAALTGRLKMDETPKISPQEWLTNMEEKIRNMDLRYETELVYNDTETKGWQKVRTLKDMLKDKKANCIDMSVWISKEALAAGFKSYIIANSGHALCAISLTDQTPNEAIAFESTNYLKPPLKPPDKPGGKAREYKPNEEIVYPKRKPPRAKEAQEVYIIDLTKWAELFVH